MMDNPEWLPGLVLFSDFNGEWDKYIEYIYSIFKEEFVDNRVNFRMLPVRYKIDPIEQNKEDIFWHITSKEDSETKERYPDIRRCERIRWPKAIIESEKDIRILCWKKRNRGEDRISLLLPEFNYLIILADRKKYVVLITAYFISDKYKTKMLKEYQEYGPY